MSKINRPDIKYTIASIIFSDIIEETFDSTNFKNIGQCTLEVYGNEGLIPHFHIVSKDRKFNYCVCIDEPRYFTHGTKNDTLTNQQAAELYDFVRTKTKLKTLKGCSVWKAIKIAWDLANDSQHLTKRNRPPKYSDLNMYESVHD